VPGVPPETRVRSRPACLTSTPAALFLFDSRLISVHPVSNWVQYGAADFLVGAAGHA
jgi:hypothetical protein